MHLQWLTDKEIEKYAKIMQSFSKEEQEQFSKDWNVMIAEAKKFIHEDPYGSIGQDLAKRWMDLVKKGNPSKELRIKIWEAYRDSKYPIKNLGYFPDIPQDVVEWIDKAVYFMYCGKKK